MIKKTLTVVGARPQIIKAAAVSRAIREAFADRLQEVIVHTGQHYDYGMSQRFFDELQIPSPQVNLGIGSMDRAAQIAAMIKGLHNTMKEQRPSMVLLYGDTNSTLAGALAASSAGIPVAHVEAGLRSYNKSMPEEINRIATDHVSTLMFVPTKRGIANLVREGFDVNYQGHFSPDHPGIFHCGDVMFDNALFFGNHQSSEEMGELKKKGPYFLATLHRDHNTDQPHKLEEAMDAFIRVIRETGHRIILPLHPRTASQIDAKLKMKLNQYPQLELIEPASYLDMISLLRDTLLVITDSGGLQKESFFFQKPCVIMRPQTEWTELVENGNAIVCDTDPEKISSAVNHFMNKANFTWPAFYGDGRAAHFICEQMIAAC